MLAPGTSPVSLAVARVGSSDADTCMEAAFYREALSKAKAGGAQATGSTKNAAVPSFMLVGGKASHRKRSRWGQTVGSEGNGADATESSTAPAQNVALAPTAATAVATTTAGAAPPPAVPALLS